LAHRASLATTAVLVLVVVAVVVVATIATDSLQERFSFFRQSKKKQADKPH
jgi:type II secretory pathway component PulK